MKKSWSDCMGVAVRPRPHSAFIHSIYISVEIIIKQQLLVHDKFDILVMIIVAESWIEVIVIKKFTAEYSVVNKVFGLLLQRFQWKNLQFLMIINIFYA